MNVGDNVVLTQDVPPARAGSKGVVKAVDSQGNLGVDTTHDPQGNPRVFALPPTPPDRFAPA